VRPFYERAVSSLDRPLHRSLWALVIHSSVIEGPHTTKNTASEKFAMEKHSSLFLSMLVMKKWSFFGIATLKS
jgi:hypothetical protein